MKFKKKPIIIEAEQYNGDFVRGICSKGWCVTPFDHVHTIHDNQTVKVEIGDWIIPEPNGENFYPCKDEIFRNTYDKIETKKE